MEKKRALVMNALVIAAVLLLSIALLIASKLTQRRIVPNAGPLEMEFEPAVTTAMPSAHEGEWVIDAFEEDLYL